MPYREGGRRTTHSRYVSREGGRRATHSRYVSRDTSNIDGTYLPGCSIAS